MITITMNEDFTLSCDTNIIPAQYSSNIPFEFVIPEKYQDSLIIPGYIYMNNNVIKQGPVKDYVNGQFSIPSNGFKKEGLLGIAFTIITGSMTETTTITEFQVRDSVDVAKELPDEETWQQLLKSFMDYYMQTEYMDIIENLIKTSNEHQIEVKRLQTELNESLQNLNELVQDVNAMLENGDFTPKFSVGTVANGEVPSVNMTGNMMNPILNFIFEKGDKGISMRIKKWTVNTQYLNNNDYIDCVAYNGTLYVCIKTHTSSSSITPLNTTYWLVGASKGDPNVLDIGTVDEGDTAQATITGEAPNQTLNLTLPKGDKGDKGDPNTLAIGTVVEGENADASIRGTSPNQILDLTLPKADPNTLTIGTVQKGENAAASITGEAPNQTLNLTLPKGDTGDGMLAKHIVTSLPAIGGESDIYFLVNGDSYTSYMYVDSKWIAIGDGLVDLSNYYTKEESEKIIYHGKNLLDDTRFPPNQISWTLSGNAKTESDSYGTFAALEYTTATKTATAEQSCNMSLEKDTDFTISFLAKIENSSELIIGNYPLYISVWGDNPNGTSLIIEREIHKINFKNNEWHKFVYSFKTTNDFTNGIDVIFKQNSNFGVPVHITDVMLEFGPYAHDWVHSEQDEELAMWNEFENLWVAIDTAVIKNENEEIDSDIIMGLGDIHLKDSLIAFYDINDGNPYEAVSATYVDGFPSVMNFGGSEDTILRSANFPKWAHPRGTVGDDEAKNIVLSDSTALIQTLTQAEYDALATKDANTLYFIKE